MMSQKYKDGLYNSIKENSGEYTCKIGYEVTEWHARAYRCAKRILSSVCFYITSKSAYKSSKSIILPTIGLYYSMYHMGVAILHIDWTTKLSYLENRRYIAHNKLPNLIENSLVKKSVLKYSFPRLLGELREIRNQVNYSFYRIDVPTRHFNSYFRTVTECLDQALEYIKLISSVVDNEKIDFPLLFCIQNNIGNRIGDNTYEIYLSEEDENEVVNYLISKGLTT